MKKQKILIIDDDADLRDSLKAVLEKADYAAVTAGSRSEGMAKFGDEEPDLVVLDVMMETWHDGFEMARELKSDPQARQIPIVMLTSIEKRTGIDVKSSAGDPSWLPVDAFLDKPVAPETLLAEIRRLL